MDNSDNSKLILMAIFCICFTVFAYCICWCSLKKGQSNGASKSQMIFGKGVGNFCSSNAMCSSNKCSSSICVL
jgi:hypothetical protein